MGRTTDDHRYAVHFRETNQAKDQLGVYEEALRFTELVDSIVELCEARFHLKDLLDKSATVITLRIAQAGAELGKPERKRHYRTARRAATDCAAILDILGRRAGNAPRVEPAKKAVLELIAQLAVLAVR